MEGLGLGRYREEIVRQTELLRAQVAQAGDLSLPIATCPGWNLGQLVRHVGGAHRWAAETTRTRRPVPLGLMDDVAGGVDGGLAGADAWLAEGAAELAAALETAGPDAIVPTPRGDGPVTFWARRMMLEPVLHRADVVLAAGGDLTVAPEVAADGIDEWMDASMVPPAYRPEPGEPELLGPGRSVHLHATGTLPEAGMEWLLDLSGTAPAWRRAHAKATAAARGTPTDLLLHLYGRPPQDGGVQVLGDAGLLELWRYRSGFWLRK